LAFYRIARQPPPGLLLGFAALKPAQIETGVAEMARVLGTLSA
jgi:DNA-binding transcriptional MocR family regulator